MSLHVPIHEPEVIKADTRRYGGCEDKVPTTALRITTHRGVDLWSRYGKAAEMQAMVDVIDGLPCHVTPMLRGIYWNSKASTVEAQAECGPRGTNLLAREIRASFLRLYRVHPEFTVSGLDGAKAFLDADYGHVQS